MEKKIANILMQSSDYYSTFAGVALTSLFENNKHFDEINVYFISDNIGTENKAKLEKTAENYGRKLIIIDAKPITEMLENAGVPKYHGSHATLLKLFVVSYIKEDIKSLLYIDSDMLVVSKIDELIDTDLDGYVYGMVAHTTAFAYKSIIGFNDFELWFNGGLLLINIDEWKNKNCEHAFIINITNPNTHLPFVDEDLTNLVLHNYIKPLDLKFNYPSTYEVIGFEATKRIYKLTESQYNEFKDTSDKVVIYHSLPIFGLRPWDKKSQAIEKDKWDYYKKISEWANIEYEDKPLSLKNKVEKALYDFLPTWIYAKMHRTAYLWTVKQAAKGFKYEKGED